jgi:hypothetical protein
MSQDRIIDSENAFYDIQGRSAVGDLLSQEANYNFFHYNGSQSIDEIARRNIPIPAAEPQRLSQGNSQYDLPLDPLFPSSQNLFSDLTSRRPYTPSQGVAPPPTPPVVFTDWSSISMQAREDARDQHVNILDVPRPVPIPNPSTPSPVPLPAVNASRHAVVQVREREVIPTPTIEVTRPEAKKKSKSKERPKVVLPSRDELMRRQEEERQRNAANGGMYKTSRKLLILPDNERIRFYNTSKRYLRTVDIESQEVVHLKPEPNFSKIMKVFGRDTPTPQRRYNEEINFGSFAGRPSLNKPVFDETPPAVYFLLHPVRIPGSYNEGMKEFVRDFFKSMNTPLGIMEQSDNDPVRNLYASTYMAVRMTDSVGVLLRITKISDESFFKETSDSIDKLMDGDDTGLSRLSIPTRKFVFNSKEEASAQFVSWSNQAQASIENLPIYPNDSYYLIEEYDISISLDTGLSSQSLLISPKNETNYFCRENEQSFVVSDVAETVRKDIASSFTFVKDIFDGMNELHALGFTHRSFNESAIACNYTDDSGRLSNQDAIENSAAGRFKIRGFAHIALDSIEDRQRGLGMHERMDPCFLATTGDARLTAKKRNYLCDMFSVMTTLLLMIITPKRRNKIHDLMSNFRSKPEKMAVLEKGFRGIKVSIDRYQVASNSEQYKLDYPIACIIVYPVIYSYWRRLNRNDLIDFDVNSIYSIMMHRMNEITGGGIPTFIPFLVYVDHIASPQPPSNVVPPRQSVLTITKNVQRVEFQYWDVRGYSREAIERLRQRDTMLAFYTNETLPHYEILEALPEENAQPLVGFTTGNVWKARDASAVEKYTRFSRFEPPHSFVVFNAAHIGCLFGALAALHARGFANVKFYEENIAYDNMLNQLKVLYLYPMKVAELGNQEEIASKFDFGAPEKRPASQEERPKRRRGGPLIEIKREEVHEYTFCRSYELRKLLETNEDGPISTSLEDMQADDVFSLFMFVIYSLIDLGRRNVKLDVTLFLDDYMKSADKYPREERAAEYYKKIHIFLKKEGSRNKTGIFYPGRGNTADVYGVGNIGVLAEKVLVPNSGDSRRITAAEACRLLLRPV